MRPFSIVKPSWWTGPTGRAITKLTGEAAADQDYAKALELRVLGTWLQNGSMHNQYGLYYAPEQFVMVETGIRPGRLAGLWRALHLLEFCTYDRESGWTWVYEMARHQLDLPFNGQDNRIKAANTWYRNLPDNPFLGPFFDRYRSDLRLMGRREGRASQAPSKGLVPDPDLDLDLVHQDDAPKPKAHRGHTVCGTRLCLPTFLFDEFKGQLGSAWREGQVEAWARALDLSYVADGKTIDDPLAVLRREFRGALKALSSAQSNGRGPGWRTRCPHAGVCGSPTQCAEKSSLAGGCTFTEALERLEAS